MTLPGDDRAVGLEGDVTVDGSVGTRFGASETLPARPETDEDLEGQKQRLRARLFDRGGGHKIGHYEVKGEIGRGGMGIVYEAYDPRLERRVAIKTLHRSADAVLAKRLVREAKSMARLNHPNVVVVHEIGDLEDTTYIVMEFVEGVNLRQWLDEATRSWAEVLAVFRGAGRGLAAIHKRGLVHRDFKPDNVMVDHEGRVLVMDLGIAHGEGVLAEAARNVELDQSSQTLTRTGALLGSPAYMAPEQFRGGRVTEKADQFSFCVSLWEALHDERPFRGDTLESLMHAVGSGELREPPNEEVPPWVTRVLRTGLRVDPEARHPSMAALVHLLRPANAIPRFGPRRWLFLAAGTGAAATAVFFATGGGTSVGQTPPSTEVEVVEAADDSSRPEAPVLSVHGTVDGLALSPDGRALVHGRRGALYQTDLASGHTRPLVERAVPSSARYGSDGALYFQQARGEEERPSLIRVAGPEGTPQVVGPPAADSCVFPATDTRPGHVALIYTAVRAVIEVPMGTEEARETGRRIPVEGDYEWVLDIDCDPVRRRVAVVHSVGSTHTLVLVDLEKETTKLLLESTGPLREPRFDATGDVLYFVAERGIGPRLESLRIGADGRDVQLLGEVLPDEEAGRFALAPNGDLVVASSESSWTVRRVPKDVSSLRDAPELWSSDADKLSVALDPGQTWLAYTETKGDRGRLLVRPLRGGPERELAVGRAMGSVAWSPDGERLAYTAPHRGQARVWTVPVSGEADATPHTTTEVSESLDLTWAPGEHVVYQRVGNRNFGVFDPDTSTERPLIRQDDVGWAFLPTASPDGDMYAVFWNRDPRGLWTIGTNDGKEVHRAEGPHLPMGWSDDGSVLYAARLDTRVEQLDTEGDVMAFPVDGEPSTVWRSVDPSGYENVACERLGDDELLCAGLDVNTEVRRVAP